MHAPAGEREREKKEQNVHAYNRIRVCVPEDLLYNMNICIIARMDVDVGVYLLWRFLYMWVFVERICCLISAVFCRTTGLSNIYFS